MLRSLAIQSFFVVKSSVILKLPKIIAINRPARHSGISKQHLNRFARKVPTISVPDGVFSSTLGYWLGSAPGGTCSHFLSPFWLLSFRWFKFLLPPALPHIVPPAHVSKMSLLGAYDPDVCYMEWVDGNYLWIQPASSCTSSKECTWNLGQGLAPILDPHLIPTPANVTTATYTCDNQIHNLNYTETDTVLPLNRYVCTCGVPIAPQWANASAIKSGCFEWVLIWCYEGDLISLIPLYY